MFRLRLLTRLPVNRFSSFASVGEFHRVADETLESLSQAVEPFEMEHDLEINIAVRV